MPEAGGAATQAGIFYQNSVGAMALADLLDLDQRIARERTVEVRLEAPEEVDDIIIRFADGHREYQSVKLGLRVGNRAWKKIWGSLGAQYSSGEFSINDRLTLVVEEWSRASEAVAGLCERAASSTDERELRARLSEVQVSALDSIVRILDCGTDAFELLRRITVRHLPLAEIERELARRRLAGGQSQPPALLGILRDIAGGEARRRGLFQPAPLRSRLKLQHGIVLGEPPEWGLDSYRETIKQLSRIEVPGMGVSGAAEDLFVWPRAREFDRMRVADFEDEDPALAERNEEAGVDLRGFPNNRLDRVVVVAGPGYGKSALLSAISGKLAEGPFVPVSVPLGSLASADSSLVSFLTDHISQELDLSADWRRLAEQGLLVLLLDGLDEVPSGARPMLIQRITTFSARFIRAPWMLTVRDPAVVTGLPEATVVELLALNDQDVERFVERLGGYITNVSGWEIVRCLKMYPDLDRLARIPLFLVMLLVSSDLTNHEPRTRSDLIEAYLKTLFSPEQHKPVKDPIDRSVALRSIAETLAFERLERQEMGATEREVRKVVRRESASPSEAEIMFEQLMANGILRRQSAIRLQFPYPIVQEYLAACHLIDRYSESLAQRIEDAMQRPWAQVIQFALELHSAPEPIIRQIVARADDAFCVGLRLVGRCIANGAKVSAELRQAIGDRLVEYWIHAPTRSRERVGRLLADGFASPPSDALIEALHHRWLISDGAGDIVCKLHDSQLTLSVLDSLIERDRDSLMIYHSLRPALDEAGDAALVRIKNKMGSFAPNEDDVDAISSLFSNLSGEAVSRDLALSVARNRELPAQARMRAYRLAGTPLEEEGIALVLTAFRDDDWERQYEASYLVTVHADPVRFLGKLLRDESIPIKRRRDLAGDIVRIIPDVVTRKTFVDAYISDSCVDDEIKGILQLFEARFGDRDAFDNLVEGIEQMTIELAGTTIALFGHFPERALAERAASLMRNRELSGREIVQIANHVSTGMLHIFEMDFCYGGAVRTAPSHPGIDAWTELVENWAEREDLSRQGRLSVMTTAAELGSEWAREKLEAEIYTIEDMDAQEWIDDDEMGHVLSGALREVRRRSPLLSNDLIEKIVASMRYNVAISGISALQALGDRGALMRLIKLHEEKSDWHLKDSIANALELVAARESVVIKKVGDKYQLDK